jgi:hypothetical protein
MPLTMRFIELCFSLINPMLWNGARRCNDPSSRSVASGLTYEREKRVKVNQAAL